MRYLYRGICWRKIFGVNFGVIKINFLARVVFVVDVVVVVVVVDVVVVVNITASSTFNRCY